MISYLRLYSVAIVFAIFAGYRFAGFHSDMVAGVFLTWAAVNVYVAEKERQRLVRERRGGYRRRKDDL